MGLKAMMKTPKLFKKLKSSKGLKVAAGGTGAALSGVSFAYDTIEYRNNQKDRQQKGATINSNDIIKEYLDQTKIDRKLTDRKISAAFGYTTLASEEMAITNKANKLANYIKNEGEKYRKMADSRFYQPDAQDFLTQEEWEILSKTI